MKDFPVPTQLHHGLASMPKIVSSASRSFEEVTQAAARLCLNLDSASLAGNLGEVT